MPKLENPCLLSDLAFAFSKNRRGFLAPTTPDGRVTDSNTQSDENTIGDADEEFMPGLELKSISREPVLRPASEVSQPAEMRELDLV
ncbi:hypothetical protein HY439_01975 [Candidatus Microgenomates bacterium]|nr:hypothetical protein [Candidatus Microgenomates bacterium]